MPRPKGNPPLRGKGAMSRAQLKAMLLDMNQHSDGPWEPAIFVNAEALIAARRFPYVYNWALVRGTACVEHDPLGTYDIHLPGDNKPFNVDAVVAKLLIAEVLESE